ncbi:type VII secretion protein EccE [Nocardia grenadensis]|uniref:type VII secretion protein EccE n=1 Tax=Nocardia grenadensis TaxID=931537 RepID=UPI000ACB5915|nr:type VII secretion protein EccE [Nocardia grenadensis]
MISTAERAVRGPDRRVAGVERGPFAIMAIGGSVVMAGLSAYLPLWGAAAIVAGLLLTVIVRFRGRTPIRWFLDWLDFRTGRSGRAELLTAQPSLRDIEVPAGLCGLVEDGDVLVAMIQLAPNLDLPTVIAEQTIYTEDTVAVESLLPMLDQYGIGIDIDIVTTGQRVRAAGSYSMLYDQLIGSHPVVGNRLTWLVLRLDQHRNLKALAARGPCAVVAPRTLATAAHRIAGRLRERGMAAHPLPAAAMVEATRLLHAGVELGDLTEQWDRVKTSVPGRFVTSFGIDWSELDDSGLDDCWTWNSGRTTLVVSLSGTDGPRAVVRYIGPAMTEVLPDYLRRLPGRQSVALRSTLPTGVSLRVLTRDENTVEEASPELGRELSIAIGPNGQILGAISGQTRHQLALPLYDPAPYNPRRRTVDVHAMLPVAQQLVLRATVVGADIEVHTSRPQRWQHLVTAVGDARSLRLAGADDEEPGAHAAITVFDQLPPQASAAPTTVSISDPGSPRRGSVDLSIEQVGEAQLDVRIPMRTVRVNLVEPRGETRFLDHSDRPPTVSPPPGNSERTVPVTRPHGYPAR